MPARLHFQCAPASSPEAPKKIRVGIPAEFFPTEPGGLNPSVRKAVEDSLERLRANGAELVPISLPHVVHSIACYYVIAVAEASSNLSRFDGVRFGSRSDLAREAGGLERFYCENRALFGKEVKRRILLGTFTLSAGYQDAYYLKACQVRSLIRRDFERAFQQVDLIASPVAPTTAFKLGAHSQDPLQMYLNDLYTIPANLAGLPAISVPAGKCAQGLPVGLQLMARPWADEFLLETASRVESGARS